MYELAETVSDDTKKLMEAFWPGPLTIILNKKEVVPHTTTGGLDTVAIRMPSHPVAMRLIKDSGVYIAAQVPICLDDHPRPLRSMCSRIWTAG